MTFVDNLQITLKLLLKDSQYQVPGGNVFELGLDLKSWGFSGEAGFLVMAYPQNDELLTNFQQTAVIKISLSIVAGNEGSQQSETAPITVSGIVTTRSIEETSANQQATARVASNPVLYRRYFIRFVDPARFYWTQHYPQQLFTQTDYKTVFTQQQTSDLVVNYDWDILTQQQGQILINTPMRTECRASPSFYDFLIWFVDQNNGYFLYDYTTACYKMLGALPQGPQPVNCLTVDMGWFRVRLPIIEHAQLEVINLVASNPKTEQTTNDNSVTPLARTFSTIQDTPQSFTNFNTLQKARYSDTPWMVQWSYRVMPLQLMTPGALAKFATSQGNLSEQSIMADKSWSLTQVRLKVQAQDPAFAVNHYGAPNAGYTIEFLIDACDSDSQHAFLPAYEAPVYPLLVQGQVFSDQGQSNDLSYAFQQDENTSQKNYQIQIPAWNNIKVSVPYQPVNLNGQFYFPPYKNEQVLLSLWLNSAAIAEYLDWRTNAPLTMESQGNQIILGVSESSQTVIKHSYTNNVPQLDINRQLQSDTETISVGEGFILLHTKQNSENSQA
ncbi:MAG: hypothetical protein ACKN9W_13815 [Methylococcus sp.]